MQNTEHPKISLVIPAYNEEKYIGACLEHAIKNSAGKFFEIIVIDNASIDRTREEAEKFPGVRVVREEKKGLTCARERGFIEAKGDLIAYIDADTRMGEAWYERVVREFAHDPDLAVLSGPYVYYDISSFQKLLVRLYWYVLALPVYLIVGYMTVGGNFVIRREVLNKMNGFDTTIAFYGEDTNIARRAHAFGKVKFALRFEMDTSGRRLAGQGAFKTMRIYVANFLSEVFLHRPVTQEYEDIR